MQLDQNQIQERIETLWHYASHLNHQGLSIICCQVVQDSYFQFGFGSKTGSNHSHHAYPGGLAVHTCEVLQISQDIGNANHLTEVNLECLAVAAIFHDYAKIWDYNKEGRGTLYRDLIRHVSGSYASFYQMAFSHGVPQEETLIIGHCILAHHGRHEWGSPIEPQTIEADILHYADMLSMKYGVGR